MPGFPQVRPEHRAYGPTSSFTDRSVARVRICRKVSDLRQVRPELSLEKESADTLHAQAPNPAFRREHES